MSEQIDLGELRLRCGDGLSSIEDWERRHRPPPDVVLALIDAVEAVKRHGHNHVRIVKHAGDIGECPTCQALARFTFAPQPREENR